MLDFLKDTHNSPSPWFNVVPSLSKICQAVVAKNDQANLQPALNNGTGGLVSLWMYMALFFHYLKQCCKELQSVTFLPVIIIKKETFCHSVVLSSSHISYEIALFSSDKLVNIFGVASQ